MMRGVDPEKSQRMWRSLAEFDDTPATLAALKREFPPDAIAEPDELKRRTFLKLVAASLALAGCTRQPIQQMVPYVKQPEEVVLGEPLYFATAMPLGGFGTGILVKSREGRPIKADGNPLHPASGNGSSIWIQACLLDLYNPERAKSIRHFDQPSTYATFAGELNEYLRPQKAKKGAGLRILTQTVTSPTLSAQLGAILENFPEACWVQWEPFNWDNPLEGARLAFGEPCVTHYDMAKADVIACFESDFLYTHPQRLHYTRDFTNGRRVVAGGERMNRLYVVESSPTVTGSMADNRLPLAPSKVERALYFVAKELGLELNGTDESLTDENRKWLAAMVFDLEAHRGNSVVLVGEGMPARLHALEQKINDRLKNFGETVTHTAPALARPENQLKGLAALRDEMASGACDLLLVIGGNPAFDAPADFDFAGALKNVKHAIHLSPESNETSRLCDWHLPEAHFLEAWSDIRSFDGTTTIMQPLIAPLFGGISEHELLDTVLHLQPVRGSYDIVREFWRGQKLWDDFEMGWRKAVHDGLIVGSALPEKKLELKAPSQDLSESSRESNDLELTFRPDPNLWDGRFASNPWLKETPKPLSKITWDNAAMIGPALAHRENLKDGDIVELQIGKRSVEAAVFLQPGQAHNTVTLHLGSGGAEQRHGFNFYPLRESGSPAYSTGLRLRKTGRKYPLVATQTHQRIDSEDRQIYRDGTLAEFAADHEFLKRHIKVPSSGETLYDPKDSEYPVKWGMAVDLTTCIGCNACVVACNIENNIPVVGKHQVALNREMLWLRIDTYYKGPAENPRFNHQPVPCMHCENAPCEYVCPVEATVHDHEGLNLQVYNRCIGTRYCSNNCPYKVRRFNFLRYSNYHSELEALRNNPEVTVRWRGVMEKCTYCVQRIAAARIRSGEENRAIRDGEVKAACQEACPAGAIIFGIMTDPESAVSKCKAHPLDYPMLGQLNTRPRTTYAGKLRNPNPEVEEAQG